MNDLEMLIYMSNKLRFKESCFNRMMVSFLRKLYDNGIYSIKIYHYHDRLRKYGLAKEFLN